MNAHTTKTETASEAPEKTLPNSIVVIGRRWFNRTFGNTYFSVVTVIDGKPGPCIEYEYGYGDHYLWRAFDEIERAGFIRRKHYNNGGTENPTIYCRENGIACHVSVSDVQRKKDL